MHREKGELAGETGWLPHLRLGDVAFMNRGLPSDRLIGALVEQGVEAVEPMDKGESKPEISAFLASSKVQTVLPVDVRDPDGRLQHIEKRIIRLPSPRERLKQG